MTFRFELCAKITLTVSGEDGETIGRAEYANGAPPSYLVRYCANDGRATEQWWEENALTLTEDLEQQSSSVDTNSSQISST